MAEEERTHEPDSEDEGTETVEAPGGIILDRRADGSLVKLFPDGAVVPVPTDQEDPPTDEATRAALERELEDQFHMPPPPPAPPVLDSSKPAHEGWLLKEGGQIKTWRRRYFVLTFGSRLTYYEKKDGKRISEVDLTGAQVIIPFVSKRPFCFHVFAVPPSISGSSNKRSKYVLCGESEEDRDAWITAIRRVSMTLDSPAQMASASPGFFKKVAAMASTNVLRQMVSKNKLRFQRDGFDLDLSYVSDRIIAMGFPSEGTEAMYRNRYEDVYRFLERFHTRHYKVYNLCSERSYPPTRFHNRVAIYPFDDHNVPTLQTILDFCNDVHRWLQYDERNIVAVHCKAGKGRTGLMVSSYLMFSGMCANAEAAARKYAEDRTEDQKGITIRCQLQYLGYFERVVREGALPATPLRRLRSITMYTTPKFDATGGCNPYFYIFKDFEAVYCSKPPDGAVPLVKNRDQIDFRVDVTLRGDLRIVFWDQDTFTEDDEMFYFWINTAYIPESGRYRLERQEIDLSVKDKKNRVFDEKFAVEVVFDV